MSTNANGDADTDNGHGGDDHGTTGFIRRRPLAARIGALALAAILLAGAAGGLTSARHALNDAQSREHDLNTQATTLKETIQAQREQDAARARLNAQLDGGDSEDGDAGSLANPDAATLADAATLDTANAEQLFSKVFTWDSSHEYTQARDALAHDWGLAEDGDLLNRLMPPDTCNTDSAGTTYCIIDQRQLSSAYMSMDATRATWDHGTRIWVGDVTYRASAGGGPAATAHAYFAWSVGPDGTISAVDWIDSV